MDQFLLHRLPSLNLCSICRSALLRGLSISQSPRHGIQNSTRIRPQERHYSNITEPNTTSLGDYQASPLEGYYKLLLEFPLPSTHKIPRPSSPKQDPEPTSPSEPPVTAKARVVFGSRLAGPSSRPPKTKTHNLVAGIPVPSRPTEPDNCCMSGCVNCVWDTYRDEMEEWAAAMGKARRRLCERVAGTHVVTSTDDGGGREGIWDNGGGLGQEDLFGNIPVGIREFMRTEKRLKERHLETERVGGSVGG